jgi:hypothetical protein
MVQFPKLFSQRNGFKKIKDVIQKESMDDELRIGLWNIFQLLVCDPIKIPYLTKNAKYSTFLKSLWINFFKLPLDTLSDYWPTVYTKLRKSYFAFNWVEVYDFIEFVAQNYPQKEVSYFVEGCNIMLEKEVSAYRFIGLNIVEISSQEEIDEIQIALKNSPIPVQIHLNRSLELLTDRKNSDYRNSIKESISAVESICKLISKNKKATLEQALTQIEKEGNLKLHSALKNSFSKLYGFTNDAEGIRHALLEETTLSFEDAKFMLVSSSAFINYLLIKSHKAKIKLE